MPILEVGEKYKTRHQVCVSTIAFRFVSAIVLRDLMLKTHPGLPKEGRFVTYGLIITRKGAYLISS